jgi:hypothetical protein
LNEPRGIELRNSQSSQPFVEQGSARRLGSSDWLPDLSKIRSMQVDQIAECHGVPGASRERRIAAIDPSFDIQRHASASFRRSNVSLTYSRFRRT